MGVRFKKAKNGLHLNLSGHHCLKRRCQEDVLPGRLRFDLEFSGVTLTTHGTSKSHHGGWRCLQNPRRFMPRIICAKRCHFPRSKLRANLTRPTQTSASHTPGCPNSQCTRSSRLGRMHPFGQKRPLGYDYDQGTIQGSAAHTRMSYTLGIALCICKCMVATHSRA